MWKNNFPYLKKKLSPYPLYEAGIDMWCIYSWDPHAMRHAHIVGAWDYLAMEKNNNNNK